MIRMRGRGRRGRAHRTRRGRRSRVDVEVVADVVAVVGLRRRVARVEPDRVDAQIGEVWQSAADAGEIADAVAVRVGEGPHVQLVDDRRRPPRRSLADQRLLSRRAATPRCRAGRRPTTPAPGRTTAPACRAPRSASTSGRDAVGLSTTVTSPRRNATSVGCARGDPLEVVVWRHASGARRSTSRYSVSIDPGSPSCTATAKRAPLVGLREPRRSRHGREAVGRRRVACPTAAGSRQPSRPISRPLGAHEDRVGARLVRQVEHLRQAELLAGVEEQRAGQPGDEHHRRPRPARAERRRRPARPSRPGCCPVQLAGSVASARP